MERSRSRLQVATAIMAACALIIAMWSVVAQGPAGAGSAQDLLIRVRDTKSDCTGIDRCGYTSLNSISEGDVQSDAIGTSELQNNSVLSGIIGAGAVQGSDVANLSLDGRDILFPGVTAVGSAEVVSNAQFGLADPPVPTESFHNYDSVAERGLTDAWTPCTYGSDPARPCLRVPETGPYMVTLHGTWENNTAGNRAIALNVSSGCGPTTFGGAPFSPLRVLQSASTLSQDDSLLGQHASGLVDLIKGQCLVGYVFTSGAGSNQDVEFTMSLVQQ